MFEITEATRITMDNLKEYVIEKDDVEVKKMFFKKTLFGQGLKNDLVEISDGVFINPIHIVIMEKVRKIWNMSRQCFNYIK